MKIKLLSAALVMMLIIAGCSKSSSEIKRNDNRLQILGQEFINDISNTYLPLKDNPSEYAYEPIAASTKNGSYNAGLIQSFAEKQQKDEDCQITMAFTNSSLVFSRLIYEDGVGYYLRYQHDEKNKSPVLEVSGSYFDKTLFVVNGDASSATLTIEAKKTEIASFIFKNIVDTSKSNTEETELSNG